MAKKLSEQALIRGNRVEKSLKIIKRTCSSIRDLRVYQFENDFLFRILNQENILIYRKVSEIAKISVSVPSMPVAVLE